MRERTKSHVDPLNEKWMNPELSGDWADGSEFLKHESAQFLVYEVNVGFTHFPCHLERSKAAVRTVLSESARRGPKNSPKGDTVVITPATPERPQATTPIATSTSVKPAFVARKSFVASAVDLSLRVPIVFE
jgi:hypothetical protein